MTRRQKVLQLLKIEPMSCWEMCGPILQGEFMEDNSRTRSNLTSSLSGTLNQMVVRGEIEYAPIRAIRGGAVYKLKII